MMWYLLGTSQEDVMIVSLQVWKRDVPSVVSALESANIPLESHDGDDGAFRMGGSVFIRCSVTEEQRSWLQYCPGLLKIYDKDLGFTTKNRNLGRES